MTVPEVTITAKDWDNLLTRYPEADLFISLIALPKDQQQMKLWTLPAATRPKVAVVMESDWHLRPHYSHLVHGQIAAILMANPEACYDPKREVPEAPLAAFNDRWLLLTPATVNATIKDVPSIFLPPPHQ